jgi:uncharacterized membrane protein
MLCGLQLSFLLSSGSPVSLSGAVKIRAITSFLGGNGLVQHKNSYVSVERLPVEGLRRQSSGVRIASAASVGLIGGILISILTIWQAAVLIGWDVTAVTLVAWIWIAIAHLSPDGTKSHASREDPSIRMSELIVLTCGVAMLAAVGLVLVQASHAIGGMKAYLIGLGVVSVALSWALVHTVFTLRYARAFFGRPMGGIDFNESDPPTYLDFAYLAVTVGMTFQVSDTDLTTKRVRRIALVHAMFSYLFGAVIVGLVINVVASLLK